MTKTSILFSENNFFYLSLFLPEGGPAASRLWGKQKGLCSDLHCTTPKIHVGEYMSSYASMHFAFFAA
jgi:hypothetical protein